MDDFVKERDVAFIHFVKTDDLSKVKAYCKRYGVKMPKNWKVMAAGVYKAVQYITSMPEDVKELAMMKCLQLGYTPLIRPNDMEGGQDNGFD